MCTEADQGQDLNNKGSLGQPMRFPGFTPKGIVFAVLFAFPTHIFAYLLLFSPGQHRLDRPAGPLPTS